jgi:hypothetical protein
LFDEGCSKLLDQRTQAKLHWLQDPSEINGDNLNNVRREANRYFRNKKKEYLKGKINELAAADNIETIKKNTESLVDASKEVCLEINLEKTKYRVRQARYLFHMAIAI